MNKHKLALFPYNLYTKLFLMHRDTLSEYEVSSVISYIEDSRSLQKCADEYGIESGHDYQSFIPKIDAVLLLDDDISRKLEVYIDVIYIALSHHKQILCSAGLYHKLCAVEPSISENLTVLGAEQAALQEQWMNQLHDIPVPVVAVAGVGEKCSKFETEIMMRNYFEKQGYKVSVICSNDYGELFDMNVIPQTIFDSRISFETKIYSFNQYVHNVYISETPDIIILGIPGGLSAFGKVNYNHFSEIALIITNAITMDCGVVCLYFEQEYSRDYLKRYKEYCYYKYNIPVESFCLSRNRVQFNFEENKILIYSLDNNILEKLTIGENSLPIVSKMETDTRLFDSILERLGNNPQTI